MAPCVYEFTKRGWLGSSSASSPPASGSGSHSGVSIGADSDRLSELRDGTRVMKLLDRRKEPAGVNEPRPAVAIVTASRGGLRQSGRVKVRYKPSDFVKGPFDEGDNTAELCSHRYPLFTGAGAGSLQRVPGRSCGADKEQITARFKQRVGTVVNWLFRARKM